jgi:alpha-amylase
LTVGESWNPDHIAASYVINREMDLAFEFDLAFALVAGVNNGTADGIRQVLINGTSLFPTGQYGTFITNHDMARVMTQLGGDAGKAKAAASIYLTLPGVPFIYYGEEIGMVGEAPDEQGRRPMQWTGGRNAGFSTAAPWKPVDAGFPAVNVAAQDADPTSLLNHYRQLIALRNQHSPLRTGTLNLVDSRHPGVFASLRVDAGEAILVVVNLTAAAISDYGLSLASGPLAAGQYGITPLMGTGDFAALSVSAGGRFQEYLPLPQLPPYGTLILQLVQR